MPAAVTSYCGVDDLRRGDIPLPAYMGDGGKYVDAAAEEIDSQVGHLYQTPILIPPTPQNRPSILFLKKINWLIASGRLLLDMAAASENQNQHAYGMGMLKEGLALLNQLAADEVQLLGAIRLDADSEQKDYNGPAIFNEDEASLVQGFYDRHNRRLHPFFPLDYPPVVPQQAYGNNQ